MRRAAFLKSLAVLAEGATLPLAARAGANLKMMIPANPGGGSDTTGRALGKVITDAQAADTVSFNNKGGAAGALGPAQFVNGSKGDPDALMVMGAVMLGGIIAGKPPVSLGQATQLARLTDEYIAAAMIAREVGVDPSKIKYVAFRGGGEAAAAILGGRQQPERVFGVHPNWQDAADCHDLGHAHHGTGYPHPERAGHPCRNRQLAPGVRCGRHHARAAQGFDGDRAQGRQVQVLADALEKNGWTPAVLTGAGFEKFVDGEFTSLRATMVKSGMV